MSVKKFRKKPVVIEAMLWDGTNAPEIIKWVGANQCQLDGVEGDILHITTLESNDQVGTRHAATVGDYVIKGVQGEFYFCKPDIFEETYSPADEPEYIATTFDGVKVRSGDTVWVKGSVGIHETTVSEPEVVTGYELFGPIPVNCSWSTMEAAKAHFFEQ